MENIIGLISVIMVFSIPLTAIILKHVRGNQKLQATMMKDEIELEKLKLESFIAETENMRLQLEKMKFEYTKTEDPVLLELQKEKVTGKVI